MNSEEINRILSFQTCKIVAPAGHGKTEMISQLVLLSEGTQLILTHTNAGVDALRKRMVKNHVPNKKYTIFTIAGFCMLWCRSFPVLSEIDPSLNPLDKKHSTLYYNQLYKGTNKIFLHKWAQEILGNSFTGLIVDEYQDCMIEQHEIFCSIAKILPVRVLGDPMQAIFQWAGELIDMDKLLFPNVDIETQPWRWVSSNLDLGQWISQVRNALQPTLAGVHQSINFLDIEGCVKLLPSTNFNGNRLISELRNYSSVAYITALENKQLSFAQSMGGFFQFDEKQKSDLLYKFAEEFSRSYGTLLCRNLLNFLQSCASHVSTDLESYIKRLENGSFDFVRIQKHKPLGNILIELNRSSNRFFIKQAIDYVTVNPLFNVYRREAFVEMKRAIDLSEETGLDLLESMSAIRHDQNNHGFYKRLSTRTVLAKGLEFDCVIVDLSKRFTSQDFYVAISRAKKMVYILSDHRNIVFTGRKS